MQQLHLSISLREDATFASLLTIDTNRLAVQSLRGICQSTDYSLIYLHGPSGGGRSHLLQAVCHEALEAGLDAVFLPLGDLVHYRPEEVFARLENQRVVCLDDVAAVAGNPEWEVQLFNFINRKMLLGGALLMASSGPPVVSGFQLPDLMSRLQQGLVLAVPEPGDEDKARVFIWRGHLRGMRIPPQVAQFILTHSGRDLHQLMRVLDDIDIQSLKQKRRITLPFVRDLLKKAKSG